ncbi:hypothetical protein [Streptomyces sp. NBC_01546]|uniref:ATP-dependent DNA ligase n=1 Tax=Streptomyces sp. NBC_01546 TaxID=2975872 RepID=UPI003868056E
MPLFPPLEPMLAQAAQAAQAAESVPGPGVLAGGLAFEQKFDGHRALLYTPYGPGGQVLLQTRRGSLIQERFPDLVAAVEQLPGGLVLDGELLVWDPDEGRLSFEALQRRAAARGRSAPTLAARWPAYFVAFDVLQLHGTELLNLPYRERRTLLEDLLALFTGCGSGSTSVELRRARSCPLSGQHADLLVLIVQRPEVLSVEPSPQKLSQNPGCEARCSWVWEAPRSTVG